MWIDTGEELINTDAVAKIVITQYGNDDKCFSVGVSYRTTILEALPTDNGVESEKVAYEDIILPNRSIKVADAVYKEICGALERGQNIIKIDEIAIAKSVGAF